MKKKYVLKKWVKVVLGCLEGFAVLLVFILIGKFALNGYDKVAESCDAYKGHICSVYEVQQYGKGIR